LKIIPDNVQNLIDEFAKLPGIGPKTAQRLAFYLLRSSETDVQRFGEAAIGLKKDLKICKTCCNISIEDECQVCADSGRDKTLICVVGEPLDIVAVEKTGHFKGVYHVLGGVISPVEGIGPDDLYIQELVNRAKSGDITEIILATNPNLEGETTALYIQKVISPLGVKVTRLAHGLPVGGDLEYADEITLSRAIEGRREY
jgi:recombination protein RecR